MTVVRFWRRKAPFKYGLGPGDHFCLYVIPLMLDIERACGVRIDSMRLRGGRWQCLLVRDGTWVFTDDLIAGKVGKGEACASSA